MALLESIEKASDGPTLSNLIEVALDDGQFFDTLPVFETIFDKAVFPFKATMGAIKEIVVKINGPGGRPSIFIKLEALERCCSKGSRLVFNTWFKAIEASRYLFVGEIEQQPVNLLEGFTTVKVTKTAMYRFKCINSSDGSSFIYGSSGTVESFEAFTRVADKFKKQSRCRGFFLGLRNVEELKADNCLAIKGPHGSAWDIFCFLARSIFFSVQEHPAVRNVLKHLDGISLLTATCQSEPVLHHFHFKQESLKEFGIEALGKDLADLIFANDPSVLLQLGIRPLDGPLHIKIVTNDLGPTNTEDIAVLNLIGGTYYLILKEYLSNPSALELHEKTMAFTHLIHVQQHQRITFKSETIVKIPASTIQEHIKLLPSDGFLRIDMIKGDSMMISKGTVVPDPEGNNLCLEHQLGSLNHFRAFQTCLSHGSFAGPAINSTDAYPIHLKWLTPDQSDTLAEVALKDNFEGLVRSEWNSVASLSLVFSNSACIQNVKMSLIEKYGLSHEIYNFDDSIFILPTTTLSLSLNHQSVPSKQRWVALGSPSDFYSQTKGKQNYAFAIRRNWPLQPRQQQQIQAFRYSFKTGKNKLTFKGAAKIMLDLIFGKKCDKFHAGFSELSIEPNKGSFLVTLCICEALSSESDAINKFMSESLRLEAPIPNAPKKNNGSGSKQIDLPKSTHDPELDWKEYRESLQKEIAEAAEHFDLEKVLKECFDPEEPDFGEGLRMLVRGTDSSRKEEPKEFHRWTPLSQEIERLREQLLAFPGLQVGFTFSPPSTSKSAGYMEEASFSVVPGKVGIYIDALESLVFNIVGLRLRPIVKRFGARVNPDSPNSVILYVELFGWDAIPQGHQLMTYFGDAWSSVEMFAAKSLE